MSRSCDARRVLSLAAETDNKLGQRATRPADGTARGVVVAEGAEREDVGADVAGEGAANAQEPYHRYEQSHRSCCC